MVLGLVVGLLVGPTPSVRANGCGVPFVGTTYSFSSRADFANLRYCDPTWTYLLVNDVDLAGVTIRPRTNFTGTFDGQGFTISNMAVTGSALFNVGVSGATFRRVNFENATVRTGSNQANLTAGALVGDAVGPVSISAASFQGTVIAEGSEMSAAGGLVGRADGSATTLADISISATVSGGSTTSAVAGGIVGFTHEAVTITDASFTGTVQGGVDLSASAGGFVGNVGSGVLSIVDSFASGAVIGGSGPLASAGGFIGTADGGRADVHRSYFTGDVSGGSGESSAAGGFVGLTLNDVSVSRSYMIGDLTGGSGNNAGAAGFVGFGCCSLALQSIQVTDSFARVSATGGTGGASRTGGIVGVRSTSIPLTTSIINSYGEGTFTSGLGSQAWSFALSHAAEPTVSATTSFCVTECASGGSGVGTTVSATALSPSARTAGWDFTDVWCVSPSVNDGLPVLRGLSFGPNAAWASCHDRTPPLPNIVPLGRLSFDTNGGTCAGSNGVSNEPFMGHRYLPGAAECSREGHEFVGWARVSAPNTVVDLPLLVDPSDGVKRYFLAENADLIAVWRKSEDVPEDATVGLDDLTGTSPGAFVGGPDRRTREGGGVVDGYYIPPGTVFGAWMLAR